MIIAATGHRPDKLGGYTAQVGRFARLVARECLQLTPASEVVSGMALGWDMAVALAALDIGLPLHAAVPFEGQERRWPQADQELFRAILKRAKVVKIVSPGGYAVAKMQVRNEYMVLRADRMLALWDGSAGGTRNCLDFAEATGRPVDNVWHEYARPRVHNGRAGTAPPEAEYIGRGSPYGNPFKIGEHGTRDQVIRRFECEVLPTLDVRALRGKHLSCFCAPLPCHGDAILRKANA